MLGNDFEQHCNYAYDGSSLFYSYDRFIETHDKWDKIVFIVTAHGRWPGSLRVPGYFKPHLMLTNYDSCNDFLASNRLKHLLTDEHRQTIKAVKEWFLYGQINDFEITIERLMIADIQRIRPDAIIVQHNSQHCKTPRIAPGIFQYLVLVGEMLKPELYTVGCNQNVVWYSVNQLWQERLDKIICHMTPEVNLVCYKHMQQALKDGVWNPTLPDRVPHEHSWEHYYERRDRY
jgi:hypothetical protein